MSVCAWDGVDGLWEAGRGWDQVISAFTDSIPEVWTLSGGHRKKAKLMWQVSRDMLRSAYRTSMVHSVGDQSQDVSHKPAVTSHGGSGGASVMTVPN